MKRGRRWLAALGAGVLLSAGALTGVMVVQVGVAGAVEIGPVDPTIPDGDDGSLRDVLENDINEGDTVILQAGATYTLDDCEEGDIDTKDDTTFTVEGNGATIRQTCEDRVLEIDSTATLRNVTITGGREENEGGGIEQDGTDHSLTLEGVTVTGNEAADDGGGVDVDGDLVVRNSSITNNKTANDGGAIDSSGDTKTVLIVASTLANNCSEDEGGAVSSHPGDTWRFVNSTVTGNTADNDGALDISQGEGNTLHLVYTDVVRNVLAPGVDCGLTVNPEAASLDDDDADEADDTGDSGEVEATQEDPANVEVDDGPFRAFGSVVAEPIGGPNCEVVEGATVESYGYNYEQGSDTCGFDAATDKVNAADPQLGALADNGGPTHTLLPASTSPLLDMIPVASCGGGDALAGFAITADQRGVSRPQGTGCDIGAVEVFVAPVIQPTFTG